MWAINLILKGILVPRHSNPAGISLQVTVATSTYTAQGPLKNKGRNIYLDLKALNSYMIAPLKAKKIKRARLIFLSISIRRISSV